MTLRRPLSPIEFALEQPCYVCGAEPGKPCRRDTWSTGAEAGGARTFPHFGRAGMPSARGWRLEAAR